MEVCDDTWETQKMCIRWLCFFELRLIRRKLVFGKDKKLDILWVFLKTQKKNAFLISFISQRMWLGKVFLFMDASPLQIILAETLESSLHTWEHIFKIQCDFHFSLKING